jgi:hypothetical protein
MSLFAGVGGGGGGGGDPASSGGTGRALLELTPHKVAVCHLVQVFAPPAQAGGDVVPPFPFESVAHHNRLGLFLFTLTRVTPPTRALALLCLVPYSKCCSLLRLLSLPAFGGAVEEIIFLVLRLGGVLGCRGLDTIFWMTPLGCQGFWN